MTRVKEGHLSHEEIAEKLQNFEMDSDQMDDFFDQLNDNDITLVNEKDSSDTDEKLNPNDLSALLVSKLTTQFVCILKRLVELTY